MNKSDDLTLEYDAFIRSVKRNKDISHSFLLGAGASISSGIQTAYDCIWEWKKDIYMSKNPNAEDFYKDFKNNHVRKSIQLWLDNEGVYPQLDVDEEYSFYAQKAYPIADDRRKYFQMLIEGKEPYIGYKMLCLLCKYEIVKAIWTTNFDGLVIKAAHQANITPIEVTLDTSDRIFRNQSRNELLSIALHGDFKYNTLKNTAKELDSQNEKFIDVLKRYHNDKNLIIIGYSGRDKSLIDALKKTYSSQGSGRLYWCGYGHKINDSIAELIEIARANGREAFFVPTEGFDKTLLHLSKACFEDNNERLENINKILKASGEERIKTTAFSQQINRTDKYIKSNLHPISFPKEVFQFEMHFENSRPWATLKELTRDTNICAVPFKRKVFALSTISDLKAIFGKNIKSKISRVPISKFDIENVTSFKNLMLQAILKSLIDETIETNFKDKVWLKKSTSERISSNNQKIYIHRALRLSLFFDKNSKYAYLAFHPSIHLTSTNEISIETKKNIVKSNLEMVRNAEYENFLNFWSSRLFKSNRKQFEYPIDSGTGFVFNITGNRAFAEIQVLDENYRAYHPKNYNKKLTLHTGIQLLEPQLIFTNSKTLNPSHDFHPMRGLINHRPWDYSLNGRIYSNEINLGVICGKDYSSKFSNFLNKLHQKHYASHNKDYLIDYPGFANAYNIALNIPSKDDENLWMDIKISHNEENIKETSLKLARLITSKIDQLNNIQGKLTVVIFIPNEWQAYRKYEIEGENFDLHDYIKAFSASKGVSTQLIEEGTLKNDLVCQINWWLSLSFYVKSLRTPWSLKNTEENTAYAGIGYSINHTSSDTDIVIGCSHIYNSLGQGLKYRLSKVNDFYLDKQSNPYLSYEDAFQFGVSIRELFYESMDKLPKRVVIHKRSKFTDDEIRGITESLRHAGIKNIDLIEINRETDARYLATNVYKGKMNIDKFAVSRGTCIVINDKTALLWTHGIVPSVRNSKYKYYMGGRSIPAPLKVKKHYGDSNINLIANEILGFTKMNWNSFNLYTKLPATINSSNQIARIGKLLSRFEGKTYDYRLFI